MNYPSIPFVGMLTAALICSCTHPHPQAESSRINFSVEGVTYWKNGKLQQNREAENAASDASYCMSLKNGAWNLHESSVRPDANVHYHNNYGTIRENDAQRILSAVKELTMHEKGIPHPIYAPGGPADRPLFSLNVQSSTGHKAWKFYQCNDSQSESYRKILHTMRTVAHRYGSLLPLPNEIGTHKTGESRQTDAKK